MTRLGRSSGSVLRHSSLTTFATAISPKGWSVRLKESAGSSPSTFRMTPPPTRTSCQMTLILEGNRSESIFFVIPVIGGLEIPDEEIAFTASRSGGPGGQNVNKVSTRVTLLFDVDHSAVLDPD